MHTKKVIKNSIWIIAQPLILNIISIFTTAYIVRTLGQSDYGKFIFTFSFIAMFLPVLNLGLRPITVREIAEDKTRASVFLGKMLILKFMLSILVVCAVAITVNLLHYSSLTKTLVYIASLTIIFQAVTSTLHDGFQAFENMKYVATSQLIGGFILTVFSVIILFIGYGVIGLVAIYSLGSLITLLISFWFFFKYLPKPQLAFDLSFTKYNLYKGAPFFFPSLVGMTGRKMGIVILSKMVSDAAVGIYGAAESLIERLSVIPDGICTAFFPSMAALHKESKLKATALFEKFFNYLFLIGLPITIGTLVLARHIIILLYGEKFFSSIIILQIITWSFFAGFINSIQSWTLGAIHQEKQGALITYTTIPLYLVMCLALIPFLKETGIAIASLIYSVLTLYVTSRIIKHHLPIKLFFNKFIGKVLLANIITGIILFLIKEANFLLIVFLDVIVYAGLVFALKIIGPNDLEKAWKIVSKKLSGQAAI